MATAQDDLESQEEQAIKAAADRVAPSVVRIETFGGLESVGGQLVADGPTTGLVVSEDGYVISSAFNFVQKPSSILVQLPGGGKRAAAEIVARDNARMLVLLKVNADEKLPVAPVVPREEMVVGQWTIALGRAYDADSLNISVGVLSARSRVWGKAIQTDAKISPSNYGGPVIDIRGRVLGVLVPLSPQSQGEMAGAEWYDSGIGFAIPVAEIMPHLEKMKRGEDLMPGILGIALKGNDIYAVPAEIAAVQPKSPAYTAGLKAGDTIVEADGDKIVRQAQLKHALGRRYAGDKVKLVAMRKDERIEAVVELAEKLEPYEHPFIGLLPMRDASEAAGIVIRHVYSESPAANAGIVAGDRLLEIDGKPVVDVAGALENLANHEPGETVEVKFQHGDKDQQAMIELVGLPDDVPDELPVARAPQDGDDVERPAVGLFDVKIAEAKNECLAYVPENYHPDVAYGLIVSLHAPGGFDREKLIAQWKSLCDDNDLILLAPRSANPTRWVATELEFIRKTMDEMLSKYNIDPHRIVTIGEQAGGAMAILTAMNHRDLVRGVVAVDSALPARTRVPANDPIQRLAIQLSYAKQAKNAARIEANIKSLRDAKYPVTVNAIEAEKVELAEQDFASLVRWIDTLDRI